MENTGYRHFFELSSLIIVLYINGGVSQLFCPNVSELNSTAILKHTFTMRSNHIYRKPNDSVAAKCFTDTVTCANNLGYEGTVVNMTHSYLEISKVNLSDAGNWTLQVGQINTSCTVVVTKTPSCNMTSYRDTGELYVGDEMTLSVDIQNYYCSRSLEMLLVTGKITGQLIDNTTIRSIQSKTVNSTFMLTDSHFGSVEVDFVCNNVSKKVPCQGENILVKQNFVCTITAGDTDTDNEVSLTVDIREYKCSQPEFMLITGSTTLELNETHRANDSFVFTSRFNLTNHHLGPVNLIFLCNNVRRRFTCDGVQTLPINHLETTQATTSDIPINRKGSGDSKIVIKAGATVAAVVIIIAIVIIIVHVVKKHCKSAKKDNSPCDDVADNVNTRSKNIPVTEYEDIGDVNGAFGNYGYENYTAGCTNDVKMVISGGNMSSDDVKTNDPRTYYSLLPETSLGSEHVYTQFTNNPKVQNEC